MPYLFFVLQTVLVATFLIAGAAKLRDRAGTRQTLQDFGVPDRFGTPLAIVLPIAELLVAASLAVPFTMRAGAAAACVLLCLFLVAIVRNLSRGKRPSCNCFGQVHSAPIGPRTIVRNVALMLDAAMLGVAGSSRVFSAWTDLFGRRHAPLSVAVALILAVLVVQLSLFALMLRQQGRLLLRLERVESLMMQGTQDAAEPQGHGGAPGIGSLAPTFSLPNLMGDAVSLGSLLEGSHAILLLFMNPQCGPCLALVAEAASWMVENPAGLRVVIVSEGTVEENYEKASVLDPAMVLLQQGQEVADQYHAWGTPSAVIVLSDGTIGSGVAQGANSIRELLALYPAHAY
ncbi:MauE/DoxX family redox-associated membrane protein [Terriglobus aquaticus]|uniref:MauE/DoxX family redox-associated membrane protein n=1 Tax=Terriglobus aquaticus TaxID=940139 RepID=A0ABW9KFX7_9BACT|nr:MauE/DoxX family redox-associated membrane protein [Terriglobus aquaticus]